MGTTAIVAIAEAVMPVILGLAGEPAQRRFLEFFTANIRNPNTRKAYARAAGHF